MPSTRPRRLAGKAFMLRPPDFFLRRVAAAAIDDKSMTKEKAGASVTSALAI
jgi:hypothetical protein